MVHDEMMGILTGPDPCGEPEELIWPETNPETIAQDESKAVTIEGGVPPFTWEITGTGFTLNHAETQDRNNVVNCDVAGCGSGIVSVTDACDQICTGALRCDVGQWDLIETICTAAGPTTFNCEYFDGAYKYRIVWHGCKVDCYYSAYCHAEAMIYAILCTDYPDCGEQVEFPPYGKRYKCVVGIYRYQWIC